MAIPTKNELINELRAQINEAVHLIVDYNLALSKVEKREWCCYLNGPICPLESVNKLISHFFETLISRLLDCRRDTCLASVEVPEKLIDMENMDFISHASERHLIEKKRSLRNDEFPLDDEDSIQVYVDTLIAVVPFNQIIFSLQRQFDSLNSRSLRLASEILVKSLGIGSRFGQVSSSKHQIVFKHEILHDSRKTFESLNQALKIVEKECGISFGGALDALITAFETTGRLPEKHSCFGKGSSVEVYFYSEVYHVRIRTKAFDNIRGFVEIYGGIDQKQAIYNTIEQIEAA